MRQVNSLQNQPFCPTAISVTTPKKKKKKERGYLANAYEERTTPRVSNSVQSACGVNESLVNAIFERKLIKWRLMMAHEVGVLQ